MPVTSDPGAGPGALAGLSAEKWEALCDGCGRCCVHRVEDVDTGAVHDTNVACRLLDADACRCTDYPRRTERVPECLVLSPENVAAAPLPASCAYRRVAAGRDLPDWHHQVCGDRDAVHRAGASVRGRVVPEADAGDLLHHLVAWPEA